MACLVVLLLLYRAGAARAIVNIAVPVSIRVSLTLWILFSCLLVASKYRYTGYYQG